MINRLFYLILGSALCIFLLSEIGCRKNEIEPKINDIGYGFFPLEIGNQWTYRVDSIHFDAFAKSVDTFTFLVKQIVVDTLVDNQGVRGSIVEVFRTDSLTGAFRFDRTVTKRIVDYRAETVDSNSKVISLVFPPTLYKFWDANLYNTKKAEEYEILDVLASENINGQKFNVVHVVQRDESFKTLRNYGIEKYAKDIGLVFARQILWTKKTIGDPTEVPNGFDYTYTLIKFEK